MCGITGFWNPSQSVTAPQEILKKMSDRLVHRGPDDSGEWFDEKSGLGLGHRRLAILDLSESGHQPKTSPSGNFTICYNGEIYNHLELREELVQMGANFSGHSDTETILVAFDHWGIEESLKKLSGMFAFAVWSQKDQALFLARDRMGEKPLYYGLIEGSLVFTSELKALKEFPGFRPQINQPALAAYLQFSYVPTPLCIFENFQKLRPGVFRRITHNGSHFEQKDFTYWSTVDEAKKAQKDLYSDVTHAKQDLKDLLEKTVARMMISDVPLGAFLSGGIDSSAIVAVMQRVSDRPVNTFSIGFEEEQYNEAKHAADVAAHLGTHHTEMYVKPSDALNVIPSLPQMYCEPFADSSQIPTHLVSKLAREHVTVSLSGDAGDEVFGGYNRYFWGPNLFNKMSRVPKAFRSVARKGIECFRPESWDQLFKVMSPILPGKLKQRMPGNRLHKLAGVLHVKDLLQMYRVLVSQWQDPGELLLSAKSAETVLDELQDQVEFDGVSLMMLADQLSYLMDDILVKVDRASMSVSLESRVPFLDPEVVRFGWRLPLDFKIRDGVSKWILREVLYDMVPKEKLDRPKMGFGIPVDTWLRSDLRPWAEELLDERLVKEQGLFSSEVIQKYWQEHLSGKRNWQPQLWALLMFQAWYKEFLA